MFLVPLCLCYKKKKKALSGERNTTAAFNPASDEDFVAGVDGTTNPSSRPTAVSQTKQPTTEASTKKETSEVKTAKAMPNNIWELAYPQPTTEQTITRDENRGTTDATKT